MPPRLRSALVGLCTIAIALAGSLPASTDAAAAFHEPGGVLFVENVGQFEAPARFLVYGGRHRIWLTTDGLWLTAYEPAATPAGIDDLLNGRPRRGRRGVHLRLTFPGARTAARLVASEPDAARMNYFLGRDATRWRVNVPTWRRVEWRGAYEGVDLSFAALDGGMRIGVRRAPDASIDAVRLRVEGGAGPRRDPSGRLVVDTAIGEVELPLLIDGSIPPPAIDAAHKPPLVFSTLLGGSGDEFPGAVRAGPHGTVVVSGRTDSPEFPTRPGAFDETYNSTTFAGDVFVSKLDKHGRRLVYSTFLGGNDTDNGMDLEVGPAGEVYVAGYTYSDDFPTTAGSYSPRFNGGCCDSFVAKLTSRGDALVYSTYIGGSVIEITHALAVGADGAAHIAGETLSPDFPTTPGAWDRTFNPSPRQDGFVAALDPSGATLRYGTYLGGSSNDYAYAIAAAPDGSVHVAGQTGSPDFPTTWGAFDRRLDGTDAFVTRLDRHGAALLYSTLLGGSGLESARAIAVGDGGKVYVSGGTESQNFPATPNAYDPTFNGYFDTFVACLGPLGRSLMFATYLGGLDLELGAAEIGLGPDGAVYLVGTSSSPDYPVTPDAVDPTLGGYSDATISKLSHDGSSLLYSTFLGGSGATGGLSGDWGDTIDVQDDGTVIVGGRTLAEDFPTTRRAFDRSYAGGNDAFVTKLRIRDPHP